MYELCDYVLNPKKNDGYGMERHASTAIYPKDGTHTHTRHVRGYHLVGWGEDALPPVSDSGKRLPRLPLTYQHITIRSGPLSVEGVPCSVGLT